MISDWDDAYANAAHIPGGDSYIPRGEARAGAFRATMGARLREIAYGPHPRQRIDLFLPEAAPRGLVVTGVLAISGLYDLRPMLRLTLNQTLHLDAAEAAAESPALGAPLADAPVIHAWVGDDERPEFVRQSGLLANVWTGLGADITLTVEPRRHHYNVIDGLTHPGSGLVEALLGEPLP